MFLKPTLGKLIAIHIYFAMTSDNVKTSSINFGVENIHSKYY